MITKDKLLRQFFLLLQQEKKRFINIQVTKHKCNYSTYKKIEAHGHNYEWVDSDKTTDEGKPMEDYKCEHCGHIKDTREKGNKELIVVGVIFGGILLIACYFIFKPKY